MTPVSMRQGTENPVMLAMIRHGGTQANEEHRYLGRTDESLSESGIKALRSFQAGNVYPEVEYLFTSPMKRCIETAKILYPGLCPLIIPEWEEMDFGRFEYKNYEELKEDRQYQAWIDSGGTLPFPEGEGRENFILRCKRGLQRMSFILSQRAGEQEGHFIHVGMIVHGGTIMALLSSCDGKDYFDYQVLNGRGYLCCMESWRDGAAWGRDRVKIRVVREI